MLLSCYARQIRPARRFLFGGGEIAPSFGGDQIIIAYGANGQLLTTDGFARIVAPGDKQGGRFVSNIAKIEVRNIP